MEDMLYGHVRQEQLGYVSVERAIHEANANFLEQIDYQPELLGDVPGLLGLMDNTCVTWPCRRQAR